MTTVFITGDRAFPVPLAYKLAQVILAKVFNDHADEVAANNFKLATGDATNGIERAIRYIVPEEFLIVVPREKNAEGHINWDKGAADARKIADKAVIIHMQPLESRVTQAILAHFKADEVDMPFAGIATPKETDPSTEKVDLSVDELSAFESLTKDFEK